jgi:hypothetical protein
MQVDADAEYAKVLEEAEKITADDLLRARVLVPGQKLRYGGELGTIRKVLYFTSLYFSCFA